MTDAISSQPCAVGEKPHNSADEVHNNHKKSYAAHLHQIQDAESISKLVLCPVSVIHGEPIVEFTIDEINEFTREEGLHQAVVMKFSYGKPDLQEIRRIFSIQFDVQGRCNIGQLEYRHLLVRFDLYTDFVKFLSRSTGYIKVKGDEYFFRTFPWTFDFNPRVETTMAVVWISFPGLPPNLFAKKSLLSIASAAGKVLGVDKATQDRTRPSAARVKVLLDLLDNHPNKIKLRVFDKANGKSHVLYQEIVYDNIPSYCCHCKHQGHDQRSCRILKGKTGQNVVAAVQHNSPVDSKLPVIDTSTVVQLKGDARDFLNAKKAAHNVIQTTEKQANNTRQHMMQLDTDNADGTGVGAEEIAGRSGNNNNAVAAENTIAPHYKFPDVCGQPLNAAVVQTTVPKHDKVADVHIEDNLNLRNGSHKSASDIPISTVSARMYNAITDTLSAANARTGDYGQPLNEANIGVVITQSNASCSKHLEQYVGKDNLEIIKCDNEEKLATQEVNNIGKNGSVSLVARPRSVAAGVRGSDNKGAGHFTNGQDHKLDQQALTDSSVDLIEKSAAPLTDVVQAVQIPSQVNNGCTLDGWTEVNRSSNKQKYSVIANNSTTSNNVSISNNFDALLNESMLGDVKKKEMHVSQELASTSRSSNSTGEGKQQQSRKNATAAPRLQKDLDLAIVTVDDKKYGALPNTTLPVISLSNPDLDKMVKDAQTAMFVNTNQVHSSNIPTLHFSNPHVEKIINDAQIAMAVHTTMVNQPIVTLNTSVVEIPSQSMESYGEYGGASGQMVLSTGDKAIKANVRGMAIESKLWANQSDYEDDEVYGDAYAENSNEDDDHEVDQESACEELEAKTHGTPTPKIGSPTKMNSSSKLKATAPVFVPKQQKRDKTGQNQWEFRQSITGQQQLHVSTSSALISEAVSTQQQTTTARTAIAQQKHSDKSPDTAAANSQNGQQQQEFVAEFSNANQEKITTLSSASKQQQLGFHNAPAVVSSDDRKRATNSIAGQQQIVPAAPVISLEDKQLLDALVSSDFRKSLNCIAFSTGRASRSRNKVQNTTQKKAILLSKKEDNTIVTQGGDRDMPKPVNVGRDIYEEGEEDDILNQYRAEASRKGDLSPMHSKKDKKNRIRERSWDGRVNADENVRRLPMRVAKQKQAYPTTSTKSTRSRK